MNLFKSEQAVIAEIHNAFDTAQERLLQDAQSILDSVKPDEITEEELAARLRAVGFSGTPTVRRVEQAEKSNKQKESIRVKTKGEAELIQYYKSTYPFLKFLTESELDRICDKYNLIHAPVGNFIGEVPEKNLRDIETAQALKSVDTTKDKMWCNLTFHSSSMATFSTSFADAALAKKWGVPNVILGENFSSDYQANQFIHEKYPLSKDRQWVVEQVENHKESKGGLFICAPSKDFNMEGLTKKEKHFFSIMTTTVKDPIVFRYVRGGVQVITKWGLEASDAALINPVDN